MDLIRAKTDRAMNVALGQMEGRLSKLIHDLRQEILETLGPCRSEYRLSRI